MKYLLHILFIISLLGCKANKQSQGFTDTKNSIEVIESSRQRIYPGQMNSTVDFNEHWVVAYRGTELSENTIFLLLDSYKLSINYKSVKGIVIASDNPIYKIEFDIEYPLSNKGMLLDDENDEVALLIDFDGNVDRITLKDIKVLDALFYPSGQE